MNQLVIDALLKGVSENPNDESLSYHLAKAYHDDGQLYAALEWFQKVVVINSKNIDAMQAVIGIANELGNTGLAEAYSALCASASSISSDPRGASQSQSAAQIQPSETEAEQSGPPSYQREETQGPRVRGQALRLVTTGASSASDEVVEFEDPSIYLSDVGGMEEVKRRLNISFLAPLKKPELVKQYGKKLAGGLILYGPPGCGKTFIARALAGELGAKFVSVSLSDILDMYIGESEKKLHEIFESARRQSPTVLFFDELDAIGHKRSQLKNSGMRTLVNQLLNEMDSVESKNNGVFILGATNLPWDIDTALKRPGRFDRVVAVFPPDLEARRSIMRYHLRKTPNEGVDIDGLAQKTEFYSGADLAHLCQSAIELVFEESLASGDVRPLKNNDFLRAMKEVKSTSKAWFESARNYALFANQGGSYDDLLQYIRDNKL